MLFRSHLQLGNSYPILKTLLRKLLLQEAFSDISFPGSAGCFQPHPFLQPSPDPTALGVCVLGSVCPQTGVFLKAWAGMKLLWAPILWLGLKKRWQRIGVLGPGAVKAGIRSSHQRIEE